MIEGTLALPSQKRGLAFTVSLTALILYIPANLLPFMTMELYGRKTTSTIWTGILALNESGSLFLGIVVFVASMLVPFLKLLIVFYLSLVSEKPQTVSLHSKLFQFIETIGRWSMLDIFLLAILIAMMKLGHWTSVTAGPGSLLFALVVILTMIATRALESTISSFPAKET